MDLETLNTFCSHSQGRIRSPWSLGEYTYASDGFFIVRVPRMEEVPERDAPSVDNFYTENPIPAVGWEPLRPETIGELVECPECRGKQPTTCPECSGDGVISHWSGRNDYEWDCKTCDGNGVEDCGTCDNEGVAEPYKTIELAGARFGTAMLRLFVNLPNCEIAHAEGAKLAWIRFDGGDALLMPLTVASGLKSA